MEKNYKYYINCRNYEEKLELANYLKDSGVVLKGEITNSTPTQVLIVECGMVPSFSEKKDKASHIWCLGFHPFMYDVNTFKKTLDDLKPISLDSLLRNKEYVDIVVDDAESFKEYCGFDVLESSTVRIYKDKKIEVIDNSDYYLYFNDLLDGKIIPYRKINDKTYIILDYVDNFYYRNLNNESVSKKWYEVHS